MKGLTAATIDKISNRDTGTVWPSALREAFKDYLQARNAFWELFVSVALAIFFVLTLAVLMIFKVISAEAGLPMLAAVISYVLAKGASKAGPSTSAPPAAVEDTEKRPER